MATVCDKCSSSESVKKVLLDTSTGVHARADLCAECQAGLEVAVESIGFHLPEFKTSGGLGSATK